MKKIQKYCVSIGENGLVRADADGMRPSEGRLDTEKLELAKYYADIVINKETRSPDFFRKFGDLLFGSLFKGPIEGHFCEWFLSSIANEEQKTLSRFQLRFHPKCDPMLLTLPWECIHKDGNFIGTNLKIAFSYGYEDWPLSNPSEGVTLQDESIRLLLVHSEPKDLEGIALRPVLGRIRDSLEKHLKLKVLSNPTAKELNHEFNKLKPHVFHFLGHGSFKDIDGQIAIVDNRGDAIWHGATSFGNFFTSWQPRLVLLLSCESGQSSSLEQYPGVAEQLVRQRIPAVVAMRYPISQAHAWQFSRIFYEQLASGAFVDAAVQAARNDLAFGENSQAHSTEAFITPIIWTRLDKQFLLRSGPYDDAKSRTDETLSYESIDQKFVEYDLKDFILPFPSEDVPEIQPLLFQPYTGYPTHGEGLNREFVPLRNIFDQWQSQKHNPVPYAIFFEFAADIQHSMKALYNDYASFKLIKGDMFFLPDADDKRIIDGFAKVLINLKPTMICIGFSCALFSRFLCCNDKQPRIKYESAMNHRLKSLCDLTTKNKHQLLLIIPNFLLTDDLIGELKSVKCQCFLPAPLFDKSYCTRLAYCEKVLSNIEIPDVLKKLIMSNSNALAVIIVDFLHKHNKTIRLTYDDPSGLTVLISLARLLTDKGFYEIAFRLEIFCRTFIQQRYIVPLSGDIEDTSIDYCENEFIATYFDSITDVPLALTLGIVTSEDGGGKSNALMQIEHRWAAPVFFNCGIQHPHWLPIRVLLNFSGGADLFSRIRGYLRMCTYVRFRSGGKKYELVCHKLLSKLLSKSNLRQLFSTPIYFLVDGIDNISSNHSIRFQKALNDLCKDVSSIGYIASMRNPWGNFLSNARILKLREMSEQQIRIFLKQRNISFDLLDNAAPSKCLRNPYLLELICALHKKRMGIRNYTLTEILRMSFDKDERLKDYPSYICETWLPQIAFEMKKNRSNSIIIETGEEQKYVAWAREKNILSFHPDDRRAMFCCGLARDYFVAKLLSKKIKENGIRKILAQIMDTKSDEHTWENCLAILTGLLESEDQRKSLIEYLLEKKPTCISKCFIDIYGIKTIVKCNFKKYLNVLPTMPDQKKKPGTENFIRSLKNIGILDPRIDLSDPRKGMVTVKGVGRLSDFLIGKYPVTNMEYQLFIEEGGYTRCDFWDPIGWDWVNKYNFRYPLFWNSRYLGQPNYPVVGVSLFEALAYCRWLSFKFKPDCFFIPDAGEWDYAAHGDAVIDGGIFDRSISTPVIATIAGPVDEPDQRSLMPKFFLKKLFKRLMTPVSQERSSTGEVLLEKQAELDGDALDLLISAELIDAIHTYMRTYKEQLEDSTLAPVGSFDPNRNGCYDMFSNTWEWSRTSLSQMDHYQSSPSNWRLSPGDAMIVKGGCWTDNYDPVWSLIGGTFDPFIRFEKLGFRIIARQKAS